MNIKSTVIDLVLGIFIGAAAAIILTLIIDGDQSPGVPNTCVDVGVEQGKWQVWEQAREITREASEGATG